jgi:hypothetical protein
MRKVNEDADDDDDDVSAPHIFYWINLTNL